MKSAAQRLADDYSSSAPDYAGLWGPVILPMALPLLDRLPLETCQRVLDIGTGVGGLVDHLRLRASTAFICGIDRAEGMVRVGARTRRGPFAVMDAECLAVRSGVFDLITMVFVLFHLPQPGQGLREAVRVLRPGGAIGLTTWGDDPGLPGLEIWTEELDRFGAGPDPRDECVRQHGLMDEPVKVRRLLDAAGLTALTIWTRRYERAWDLGSLLVLQKACGTPGRRLATLSPGERAACSERVRVRLEALRPEELVWRCEVLFAVATC
ncbi:MAG: class I SAM-dependent methyltransferase [Gemmatimonadetes bacterium]|nr:class I SAM-dependent methyltransferase [Gemmatimonadota bacterium]